MSALTDPTVRPRPEHLHHVRMGPPDAPAVLFLHGITESHRYFTKRVGPLSGAFHLVIPDLPGFGRSPKPQARYDVTLFVSAVRSLIERLGMENRPIHLVGHSLGAILCLEYAAKHPEQVQKLVLMNLPRFADSRSARETFTNGSASYRKLVLSHSLGGNLAQLRRMGLGRALRSAALIPTSVLLDCRRFTFQSLTSTLENCLLHYRTDEVLGRSPRLPTLLIHGTRDSVAPYDAVAELPERYPSMSLRAIPDAGHHLFHTHPRRCIDLIREHLNGNNGAA